MVGGVKGRALARRRFPLMPELSAGNGLPGNIEASPRPQSVHPEPAAPNPFILNSVEGWAGGG